MIHKRTVCSLTALVAAVMPLQAFALKFPCTSSWTGPSSTNTLSCSESDYTTAAVEFMVAPLIPFVMGVLFFFVFPFVFCGRYCCQCCGGSKMRPGGCCCGPQQWDDMPEDQVYAGYTQREVKVSKLMTVVCAVLSLVFVIITMVAAAKVSSGVDDTAAAFSDGIMFFQNIINDVKARIRIDGQYPNGWDESAFNSIQDGLSRSQKDFDNSFTIRSSVKDIASAAGFSAIVPAFLISISVLFAFAGLRKVLPCIFAMLYAILAVVYLMVASVFFITAVPADLLCDEVHAQIARQPGIFQWYLVPYCDSQAPFGRIMDSINQAETEASSTACTALMDYGDTSPTYTPGSQKVFQINVTDAQAQCATFDSVSAAISFARLKSGVGFTCPDPGATDNRCTIQQCANSCSDADVKNASATIDLQMRQAGALISAYHDFIEPWLSCNALIDHILKMTLVPLCNFFPAAAKLFGSGSLICGLTCILAMCVAFAGQKRWFSTDLASVDATNAAGFTNADGYSGNANAFSSDYEMQKPLKQFEM